MPTTRSAKKRVRRTKKRTMINKANRTRYKNAVRKLEALIDAGADADELDEAYREASRRIDKAAGKNIIHKNRASRLKGKLARRINRATRPDEDGGDAVEG